MCVCMKHVEIVSQSARLSANRQSQCRQLISEILLGWYTNRRLQLQLCPQIWHTLQIYTYTYVHIDTCNMPLFARRRAYANFKRQWLCWVAGVASQFDTYIVYASVCVVDGVAKIKNSLSRNENFMNTDAQPEAKISINCCSMRWAVMAMLLMHFDNDGLPVLHIVQKGHRCISHTLYIYIHT